MSLSTAELAKYDWRIGEPEPFWVLHHQDVALFVKQHRLEPVPGEHLPGRAPFGVSAAAEHGSSPPVLLRPFPWPHPCGGLKGPHLHLGQNVYILTDKQWGEFTKPILEQYTRKLEAAKTVQFEHGINMAVEQVFELDAAMAGLPDPPRP